MIRKLAATTAALVTTTVALVGLSSPAEAATQSVSWSGVPSFVIYSPSQQYVAAEGARTGTQAVITSTTPSICTVGASFGNWRQVSFLKKGDCKLTANVPASGSYSAASSSVTIPVLYGS